MIFALELQFDARSCARLASTRAKAYGKPTCKSCYRPRAAAGELIGKLAAQRGVIVSVEVVDIKKTHGIL